MLERNGVRVVAEAADGPAAVSAARAFVPDVAVLDLAMPRMNGIDAAREIIRENPRIRVILLTALAEADVLSDALRAGVRGFVQKTQGADDLLRAIETVRGGALYVSAGSLPAVVAPGDTARRPAGGLSPRERQVVQLVAEGRTTKQIAHALQISVKTAEFHRGRIMAKLHIRDTAGLVRYAIRQGMIAP